jgi:hypothetical protein
MATSPLLPERHPDADLFICDITDAAIKDDMASMEHPIFVLTKHPYMNVRRYEYGYNWFEVHPSSMGVATIYDKDILIYAISQIMGAKKAGRPYSRDVSFTAFDFLVFSNRNTGGKDYEALKDSLNRLDGTRLRTNIKTGNEEVTKGFGLIEGYTIRQEHLDGRVLEWGITLSEWLFKAIESNEVLSLNPNYFRLRRPLEKRLYEIARKHCGMQKEWRIGLDKLQHKCGSNSPKRNFKTMVKEIVKHQHLPDYDVYLINDTVLFTRSSSLGKPETDIQPRTDYSRIPPLRTTTIEQFREDYPNYDPYFVEAEWRNWSADKNPPKNPDRAFLGWAETWVANHPM